MNKLNKADQDWYNAIVIGTEWEILSSDMNKKEPKAAHIIALALDNKNKRAFSIGQVEILKALKSLCNPNPGTFRAQYDSIQAWMANGLGHDADDDRYYYAFRLVMISGGKNSETLNDFSNGRIISSTNLSGRSDSNHIGCSHITRLNILPLLKCS